jgi:hypothetical protein
MTCVVYTVIEGAKAGVIAVFGVVTAIGDGSERTVLLFATIHRAHVTVVAFVIAEATGTLINAGVVRVAYNQGLTLGRDAIGDLRTAVLNRGVHTGVVLAGVQCARVFIVTIQIDTGVPDWHTTLLRLTDHVLWACDGHQLHVALGCIAHFA